MTADQNTPDAPVSTDDGDAEYPQLNQEAAEQVAARLAELDDDLALARAESLRDVETY